MLQRPLFICLLLTLFIAGCSDNQRERNPFLPELGFRFEVNLNLPLYGPLNNQGNPVVINSNGVGVRGVVVMNTGFDQYAAWELSCPNHPPNSCSTMEVDGQVVRCSCEDYEYSLFTGQMLNRPEDGERYYDLLFYRATRSGSVVTISN